MQISRYHARKKNRKRDANAAMDKIKHIRDHQICIAVKLGAFNQYMASIFLNNCETWSLTKSLATRIDSYHRKLLRTTINVIYPKNC